MTAEKDRADEFVITRVIDAPRALVFKAWTDPAHMTQWWGPRAFTRTTCEMDVRVGGAYRIVMRSAETVHEYPITGVYREVVEPERIVMTMDCSEHPAAWHAFLNEQLGRKTGGNPAGEMLQTVTFEDFDGKTKLTIRIRFESTAIRDAMVKMGMNEGWGQSLDRLEDLVASSADREIITTRVLDAPRELVFEAWTNPKHVAQWWGPNGFTNTIHEMDVRPGGVWRFIMHGPDGRDYKNKIVFIEVVKPERLVYDHVSGPMFHVTTTFEDEGGKTRLTMRMRFETAEEREKVVKEFGAVEGAKETLERLKGYLPTMG